MEAVIFNSESKSDIKLLSDLAKKLGIGITKLTNEEFEDIALVNAIKEGKTNEFVDTESFINKLKNEINN